MNRHVVGTIDELPVGGRKIVTIRNQEIGIYNIDDELYAIKSICPHQGASLCKGVVTGTNLPSQVNEYIYGLDGEIVRCPWHNWEFNIKTGHALCDEKLRIATYKVTLEGQEIVLHL